MTQQDSDSGSDTRSDMRAALIMVALFGVIAVVFALSALTFSLLSGGDSGPSGPPRAVIVDQLDLTFPNEAFREEATQTLASAGYEVEYVPGEAVTVDYYRELATHGYDLIVLRIHAARHETNLGDQPIHLAELFTAETFSEDVHVHEQETGQIGAVYYDDPDDELFFGIGPRFVVDSMEGDFGGATVVMMGCNGLISEQMAEAFVRKGADSFISWDDLVSVDHTDTSTLNLLDRLVIDGLSSSEAAAATMEELGPDPYYQSTLLSYPLDD